MTCSQTTARGTACKGHAVEGSDRCAAHLHRGIGGRPTVLTDTVADQLVLLLRTGNYVLVACKAVGISRRTFNNWMQRGRADTDGPYRLLRDRCEIARAEGEASLVTQIAEAAATSWQAAAWILERQYPERWGRPSTRMRPAVEEGAAAPSEAPELEVEADPFAEVDQLAERRAARV